MLAMPEHGANIYVARRLLDSPYKGLIMAVAQFQDEVASLEKLGCHAAYDASAEAGAGFADHVEQRYAAELARLDPTDQDAG